MKSIKLRAVIGMSILLALSGCDEYEGVDYLNIGHPADPGAPSGKQARMSGTLVPENINVRPQLGSIGLSPLQMKTSAPAMDHSKMNHSKMKPPKAKKPMMDGSNMRGSH